MSALQQGLRRLVVISAAIVLSSITTGCLVDVVDDDDTLGEAEVALVDGDEVDPAGELEDGLVEDGLVEDEQDERGEDLGGGQREVNPEPQPWEEGLGGDHGGPEPQPWREDGDADGPEPQPWHTNAVAGGEDTDPKLPGEGVYDDDEPDPSPWMAKLAKTPLGHEL